MVALAPPPASAGSGKVFARQRRHFRAELAARNLDGRAALVGFDVDVAIRQRRTTS
jgi:hypothetical protein